jgi:hypothetical protein
MLVECRVLGNNPLWVRSLGEKRNGNVATIAALQLTNSDQDVAGVSCSSSQFRDARSFSLTLQSQTVCNHHAVVQNNAKVIARNQVSDFY